MATLRDITLPAQGNTAWYSHYQAVDEDMRRTGAGIVHVRSFAGANDAAKMTAAMAFVQAEDAAGRPMPWIALPSGSFDTGSSTFNMFSGLKIVGPGVPMGPNNIQINEDLVIGKWRTTCGSGASSLLQSTSTMYSVKMVGIVFHGSSTSQIFRSTSNLYACQFDNLFFYGCKHAIGSPTEKFLMTQMIWGGHWGFSSCVDTVVTWGGSDCSLWMGASFANIDLATDGGGKPHVIFNYCSKTEVGKIYSTNRNNWIGIQILGDSARDIAFYGGEYEGYNPTTASAYPCIDIQGGTNVFYTPKTGQVGTAAQGTVRQSGGDAVFYSPTYRRSDLVADTFPWLYQTGGTAEIYSPRIMRSGEQMRVRWSSGTTDTVPLPSNAVH